MSERNISYMLFCLWFFCVLHTSLGNNFLVLQKELLKTDGKSWFIYVSYLAENNARGTLKQKVFNLVKCLSKFNLRVIPNILKFRQSRSPGDSNQNSKVPDPVHLHYLSHRHEQICKLYGGTLDHMILTKPIAKILVHRKIERICINYSFSNVLQTFHMNLTFVEFKLLYKCYTNTLSIEFMRLIHFRLFFCGNRPQWTFFLPIRKAQLSIESFSLVSFNVSFVYQIVSNDIETRQFNLVETYEVKHEPKHGALVIQKIYKKAILAFFLVVPKEQYIQLLHTEFKSSNLVILDGPGVFASRRILQSKLYGACSSFSCTILVIISSEDQAKTLQVPI